MAPSHLHASHAAPRRAPGGAVAIVVAILVAILVAMVAGAADGRATATFADARVVLLNDVQLVDAVDVYVDGELAAADLAWGEHTAPTTLDPATFHLAELFEASDSPAATSAARSDVPLIPTLFDGQDEPGSFDHPGVPTVIRFIGVSGDRWNVNEHDVLNDFVCDPSFGSTVMHYGADVPVSDGVSGGSATNGFHEASRNSLPGRVRRIVLQGAQPESLEPLAFGTFDLGALTMRVGLVHAYIAYGDDGRYGVLGMTIDCDTGAFLTLFDVARSPVYPTSRFVPLAPIRLFDTREDPAPVGPVADESSIDVQVTGRVSIPRNGVSAVVLNVTATNTTAAGFVTVWPTGQPMPPTSSLNVTGARQTIPNLVTVPIGEDGRVSMYAYRQTDLLADVAGYFVEADSASAGRFVPLTPERIFDTRSEPAPFGPVSAGGTLEVQMTGTGSITDTGVAAVVLNLTGVNVGGAGHVTAHPGGTDPSTASNLNLAARGDVAANLVIVPVGDEGTVAFHTFESVHLLADVFGYFTDATAPTSANGLFVPTTPMRALDTRPTVENLGLDRFIPGGGTLQVDIAQVGDVPGLGSAAVLANLTVTGTVAPGHLTAWPSHLDLPLASNVNWTRSGATRPNAALVPLGTADEVGRAGPAGDITLGAYSGTHAIVDVFGYFTGPAPHDR